MKSINHRYLSMALAGMLGGFAAALATAAPFMPNFTGADSNDDGYVSLVEFSAQGGHPQAFNEGDINDDSRLSSDEYSKAVANHDRMKANKFIDDAWITAKVKALLLKDEGVTGLSVNVETHKGTVQLSGWVSNPTQVQRAEEIARSVAGVKDVRNDLLIKG